MKLRTIFQSIGLLLTLFGLSWIYFSPNIVLHSMEIEEKLIVWGTLDMPWAYVLIFLGVIFAFIGVLCGEFAVKIDED